MATCKVYEIDGPDDTRHWAAVRCHRDIAGTRVIDEFGSVVVCARHLEPRSTLFVRDGWRYAIDFTPDSSASHARRNSS